MWPFRKRVFNSAHQAIAEASKYSSKDHWQRAYNGYSAAIGQLKGQIPGRDLARLYNERGFMARNIAIDLWNSGARVSYERWCAKAHQDYDAAIEADESYWRPWFNKGNLLARDERRFQEAIPYLNKAAELNPQHAEIFNNRGLTYESLGDNQAAMRDFKRAIAIDPKNAHAHSNIGTLLYEQGKYQEAAEWYEKAIRINPSDPVLRQNLQLARSRI